MKTLKVMVLSVAFVVLTNLLMAGYVIGADYVVKKDCALYYSAMQMEHSSNLSGDAFSGWFSDQAARGLITTAKAGTVVTIVDEFRGSGHCVKIKAVGGNVLGWVYEGHLQKAKTIQTSTGKARRDGHFIAHKNKTVLDTRTNLIWAAKDNGSSINWVNAKSYCKSYRGCDYTDWRMPTQDELAGLYASDAHKNKIKISGWVWATETRGSEAATFGFYGGTRYWAHQSGASDGRALPVRSGK